MKFLRCFSRLADVVNQAINAVCVVLLTVQLDKRLPKEVLA